MRKRSKSNLFFIGSIPVIPKAKAAREPAAEPLPGPTGIFLLLANLIKSATKSLVLIDNYIDESVLLMLSKRDAGVSAEIHTGRATETLKQDVARHNAQYPPIKLTEKKNIHDRFMIIDEDVYHIGASLKDLGKKLFAFSKMTISKDLLI